MSPFPYVIGLFPAVLMHRGQHTPFPLGRHSIYITGIRHPYIKQVIQDASLAPILFDTDYLLCFGMSPSAIGCHLLMSIGVGGDLQDF